VYYYATKYDQHRSLADLLGKEHFLQHIVLPVHNLINFFLALLLVIICETAIGKTNGYYES
jgi:hypothetical protein